MIRFNTEEHHDARYLTGACTEHLSDQNLSPEQEKAVKALIVTISAGYQHTIERQSWGPGWD